MLKIFGASQSQPHVNKFALRNGVHTEFIRILATTTINFSLARVQLLIEGGSYSRVAFIDS